MRQRTNAHKLVICNFCAKNHPKMAKICILRPESTTFVPSDHFAPLKNTVLTPPVCGQSPREVRNSFQKISEIFIFGVLAVCLISNHSRRKCVQCPLQTIAAYLHVHLGSIAAYLHVAYRSRCKLLQLIFVFILVGSR